jgi:transcriptional regulator with XRE-family HTH domain
VGLQIRSRRQRQRLSLREVATQTGLSISFLSQVERDRVAPSISSLKQIARALDVTVSELLAEHRDDHHAVLRAADRPTWSLARTQFQLLTTRPDRKMEPQLITYEPHGESGDHALTHEGEEFLFVLSGRLSCWIGDEQTSLEAGDCAYFSSQSPHRMATLDDAPCVCFLVATPPTF